MRVFNIAVAMTLAATCTYAQQDLDLDDDNMDLMNVEDDQEYDYDDEYYLDDEGNEVSLDDELDSQTFGRRLQSSCQSRASGPRWGCWFRSDNYKALPRAQKLDQIRQQINATITDKPIEPMWLKFPRFFTQKAILSFGIISDDLRNRPKTTHTQGMTAEVEWEVVPNNLGYTGIYESGSDTVVMRISEMSNLVEASNGLTPSIGLKFLLDDVKSENVMAMQSMVASGDWNFFNPNLTNRLEPFDTSDRAQYIMDQTMRKKLVEAQHRPFSIGISNIAKSLNDGTQLEDSDVRTPFQIWFRAPQNLQGDLTDEQKFNADGTRTHWTDQVKSLGLGEGDVIYEVYAQFEPLFDGEDATLDDKLKLIANIRLKSSPVTSTWGDDKLYFQHPYIFRDRKFFPNAWRRDKSIDVRFDRNDENTFGTTTPAWPKGVAWAEKKIANQTKFWGCPFEWLMPENWQATWRENFKQ